MTVCVCEEVLWGLAMLFLLFFYLFCSEKKDEVPGWRRKTAEDIVHLFSKGYCSRWAMSCSIPKAGRGAFLQQTH